MATLNENELQHAVEELIDGANLCAVLEAIAVVCAEKADHIRVSYDDVSLARLWHRASQAVVKVSERVEV